MHLQRTDTPDYTTVLSLAEAKAHLRVVGNDEDSLITAIIAAAGAQAENFLQTYIGTGAEGRVVSTGWCVDAYNIIKLPLVFVNEITSITYRNSDGADATLAEAKYQFIEGYKPSQIYLKEQPALDAGIGNVVINFTTSVPDNVLPVVVHAMKIIVALLYEVRQPEMPGAMLQKSELVTVSRLLTPYALL